MHVDCKKSRIDIELLIIEIFMQKLYNIKLLVRL